MTKSGNRPPELIEVADDFENLLVETKVLRGATAGNDETVIRGRLNAGEVGIQHEVMAGFSEKV